MQKKRTEGGQVAEATNEVRWTTMGGFIQVIGIKTWKGKVFLHLSVNSVSAEICLLAKIHRNRPEWPEQTEIWSEVEQEGDSYRFKDWYEIFWPERNGINNSNFKGSKNVQKWLKT